MSLKNVPLFREIQVNHSLVRVIIDKQEQSSPTFRTVHFYRIVKILARNTIIIQQVEGIQITRDVSLNLILYLSEIINIIFQLPAIVLRSVEITSPLPLPLRPQLTGSVSW